MQLIHSFFSFRQRPSPSSNFHLHQKSFTKHDLKNEKSYPSSLQIRTFFPMDKKKPQTEPTQRWTARLFPFKLTFANRQRNLGMKRRCILVFPARRDLLITGQLLPTSFLYDGLQNLTPCPLLISFCPVSPFRLF